MNIMRSCLPDRTETLDHAERRIGAKRRYRVVVVCSRQNGQLCRAKRRMESRLPNGQPQNNHVRMRW
jgi:hypothetical protein